jgi:hypothetical protein
MIFYHPNFEIRNGDIPYVQNLPKFAERHIETQGTTFILAQLQNPSGFQVKISGTNSNLNIL